MILNDILHGIETLFLSQRVAVINKVKNFFVFTATQGPANISHILCHTGEWLGNQEEMISIYNFFVFTICAISLEISTYLNFIFLPLLPPT